VHTHAIGDVFVDDPQHPVVLLRVLLRRVPTTERDVDGTGGDFRRGVSILAVHHCMISPTCSPILGLISDLRDDRVQVAAAALSRARALRFVCLHFDHHGFVRRAHRARRAAGFRSLI
jgi:hypothetical protein